MLTFLNRLIFGRGLQTAAAPAGASGRQDSLTPEEAEAAARGMEVFAADLRAGHLLALDLLYDGEQPESATQWAAWPTHPSRGDYAGPAAA